MGRAGEWKVFCANWRRYKCRGRACPARGFTTDACLPLRCGPHMCGPYNLNIPNFST